MSLKQNAGQIRNRPMERESKSLQNVAKSKYQRTTLKNENCIHGDVKSRLNAGNS